MLLFELTRDYDVILPLMASAGVGTVWSDILEDTFKKIKAQQERRDEDTVSWGDLSVSESVSSASSRKGKANLNLDDGTSSSIKKKDELEEPTVKRRS
jgi:hypothetical protein